MLAIMLQQQTNGHSKMVGTSMTQTFFEFLATDELQTIREDLAALRTLAVEYRNGLEARHAANITKIASQIVEDAKDRYEMEDYEMEDMRQIVTNGIVKVFGVGASLSAKDATVMLNIITGIIKSERDAKKILEEQVLRIEWSQEAVEMIKKFLELIVFPMIPPEDRAAMAAKTVAFFSSSKSQLNSGQSILAVDRRIQEARS